MHDSKHHNPHHRMAQFKITQESKNLPDGAKQTTIRIGGNVDAATVRTIQDHLLEAVAKNPNHLQFDLSEVGQITGPGIILFHTALQIQQRRGGTFSLINSVLKKETLQFETSDLENNTVLVKIAGNLDLQAAGSLESRFLAVCRGHTPRVIIDLSAMDYISSMGIRLLMQGLKLTSTAGGRMLFLNPSTPIVSSLEIAGFTPFIAHGAAEDVAANMR